MSYPKFECPRRTDESFRNRTDEDHHKEDTPLTDLPIDMVEDFVVADSLHLFHLGIKHYIFNTSYAYLYYFFIFNNINIV